MNLHVYPLSGVTTKRRASLSVVKGWLFDFIYLIKHIIRMKGTENNLCAGSTVILQLLCVCCGIKPMSHEGASFQSWAFASWGKKGDRCKIFKII